MFYQSVKGISFILFEKIEMNVFNIMLQKIGNFLDLYHTREWCKFVLRRLVQVMIVNIYKSLNLIINIYINNNNK